MKNSIKCTSCGTVNWPTSSECIRCRRSLAAPVPKAADEIELPPEVVEVLALTHDDSRPTFSRYLFGAVAAALILVVGVYVFSETAGFDKKSKTSLLTRIYWGKRPPPEEFLTRNFEAQLKCEREFTKVYQATAPAAHGPCLRGELPFGYQDIYGVGNIKKCSDLATPKPSESGEKETVEVIKTEIVEGRFEKNPPIDPSGARKGLPATSATIFFRATAKMDYLHRRDTWGGTVEDHERETVSETRTLLLYWNDQTRSWMPFEDCASKSETLPISN